MGSEERAITLNKADGERDEEINECVIREENNR